MSQLTLAWLRLLERGTGWGYPLQVGEYGFTRSDADIVEFRPHLPHRPYDGRLVPALLLPVNARVSGSALQTIALDEGEASASTRSAGPSLSHSSRCSTPASEAHPLRAWGVHWAGSVATARAAAPRPR
jgi:hypothetical protein